MNLILLHPEDFIEPVTPASAAQAKGTGRIRLTGRRLDHVREIHRAEVGDRLCVGLVDDRIGEGRVTRIDSGALEMEVELDRHPPEPLPLTLVLALPRPLVLKRVLLSVVSLGVKRIVLLNAKRVERSFWNSKVLREGELSKPLTLGLEQARDTRWPEVSLRTRFKPFVEDELPEIIAGTRPIVAHPEAASDCPRQLKGPVTLIVGPEGGFVPYEIEKLEACGCESVHLGERILRVETAIPVLLARLF